MRKEIINNIKEKMAKEEWEHCNTEEIASGVRLNRNQVIKILNQLVTENIMIKITQRPFLFLHKKKLEEQWGVSFEQHTYDTLQEVLQLRDSSLITGFEGLIGYQDSLHHLVEKIKATLSYPPIGLPILLYGPTGTGKSLLAKLAYQYCVNCHLIEKDARFVQVNCSEYANNPELLTANLFGYKKGAFTGAQQDTSGLLYYANGGVLFLDEVHCLKAECQEKLFLYMDQGIYHMVGDNEVWHTSKCRIIFATTEDPEKVLLRTLLRRIPVILTIPSLQQRGKNECLQLIHYLYSQEEKRIDKKISISSSVYHTLLTYPFVGNVGELTNVIQASCVSALFQQNGDPLEIHTYHLPEKIMTSMNPTVTMLQKHQMIPLSSLLPKNNRSHIITLYRKILKAYKNKELDRTGCNIIDSYFDNVVYNKHYTSQKEYILTTVNHVFEMITNRYGFAISNNEIVAITSYLMEYTKITNEISIWEDEHHAEVKSLLQYLQKEYYRQYVIAKEAYTYFKYHLYNVLDTMVLGILTICMTKYFQEDSNNHCAAMIIAHGYSTASSIAESANKLLHSYVFDAIDMPLHIDTLEITKKINEFLKRLSYVKQLYLLVDMGSLEKIYQGIEAKNIDVAMINNVSTKLALYIGNEIIQQTPMSSIFTNINKHNPYTVHLQLLHKKEPIILCSCASGVGAAKKLEKIISQSLPADVNIKVLYYDFETLIRKYTQDHFLEDYEVICVIGTLKPNDPNIKFIAVEELIINAGYEKLEMYFKNYMRTDELEMFEKNVVKNFSLSNVMNHLTILNPNTLLEYVSKAIDQLQHRLQKQFKNHTCFGLYVHICCLIERLLTQQVADSYANINFQEEHAQFISAVKTALEEVETYYNVEIPIVEIGYIYDYINNDGTIIIDNF